MTMDINCLKTEFFKIYGEGEADIFFSPSRINLIGEHIDYNGGMVMPCATLLGTYGAVRKRSDNIVRLASANFDIRAEADICDLKYDAEHGWANYAKGVIYHILKAGYSAGGMDILVSGNIPHGAGLSSSASLELLIGEMVNVLFNKSAINRIELAKLCQEAENQFVGVMCGIMDQFAISMGKKNKVILLNCDTLSHEYIDLSLGDYTLVIMNTNKRRELYESKYNERRRECEEALAIISKHCKIKNLSQLSAAEFQKYGSYIEDTAIRNRAEHVVYENERVMKSVEALKNNDIKLLGSLLKKSHASLRDLYEVTGKELDTIVEAANSTDGCAGARMMGAGFGGCAVALVENRDIENFIKHVAERYIEKIGFEASFYITGIGDGTRMLYDTNNDGEEC